MKKTKFLRFNKLPRLNTQERPLDTLGQETNQMSSLNSFHKQDPLRQSDILGLVDSLLKKGRGSGEFELEPRDRKVMVDLPELEEGEELSD